MRCDRSRSHHFAADIGFAGRFLRETMGENILASWGYSRVLAAGGVDLTVVIRQ